MKKATGITITVLLAFSGCEAMDRGVPAPYRGLSVPQETLTSAEARAEGRTLFERHCALCHGAAADGSGDRRSALSTPPVSFASRTWRTRARPREVFVAIREGVRGTAMPGWRHLSDEEVWSLVAYLLAVSEEGP